MAESTNAESTTVDLLFSEAAAILSSKKVYYKLMQRNGFYMPSITSSICQLPWMDKIRNGEIWIPKDEDLRVKNCPAPPKKLLILLEIDKLLEVK